MPSYIPCSEFSVTIPYSLFFPSNSYAPLQQVLTTGTPKINASVTAVLKPSRRDEHTNKSAFYTDVYGLSLKPSKWKESETVNSATFALSFDS